MNPIAKRSVTALTVAAAVVCAIIYAPAKAIAPVVAIVALLAYVEFATLLKRKVPLMSVKGLLALIAGLVVIGGGLSVLPYVASTRGNLMMLYVIAIIKLSDMGGFAFGLGSKKLFGDNHKLCPSISPGKSWEGMFGSVFGSCLISSLLMPITHFGWGLTLLLGVIAAVLGTVGDLVESKFKRWVGVKDSSTMKFTNGMGGFLDMVDSLLVAPAVIAALI